MSRERMGRKGSGLYESMTEALYCDNVIEPLDNGDCGRISASVSLSLSSVTGALRLDLLELTVELDSFVIAATRSVVQEAHKLFAYKNGLKGR